MVEQKVVGRQADVLRRRAVGWSQTEQSVVVALTVEHRGAVFVRTRGAPVVKRPHECLGQRQRQHRIAQQPETPAGRCHEARALAGFIDDFARRADAFGAVVGQQLVARQPAHNKSQVPAQRLRILKRRVRAAHAKDRQQVRRVAGEDYAALHIVGQCQGARRIDRVPVHFPRHAGMANHGQLRVDARLERFRPERPLGRFPGRQLVVDTPDAVRLAVHQDGVAGVPFGVEVSQALGRQWQVNPDVGNHKQALVRRALHLKLQGRANVGAAPVGGHQPVGFQRVRAFGRVDGHARQAGRLRHADHLVAPAQVDQRAGLAGIDQVFLKVLLLDIEHRKEAVVRVVRRFHAKHALAPVVRIAKAPGQAAGGHAVGDTDLLQDFHRATGEHDGAAALRDLQLRRQHHAGHAQSRQFQRRHHARRAGTGNHHLLTRLRCMRRGPPGFEHLVAVINRRTGFGGGLVHGRFLGAEDDNWLRVQPLLKIPATSMLVITLMPNACFSDAGAA